ncbi:DUF6515 family protein [Chlamydiota bacterium]
MIMKKQKGTLLLGLLLGIVALICFCATTEGAPYARYGRRQPPPHHGNRGVVYSPRARQPRYGNPVHVLPQGYRQIVVGGKPYFYHNGVYYTGGPSGYVVAQAPMGAVVPFIPQGYSTVYVNGVEHYYYGGTYYASGPGGYVVATLPVGGVVNALPYGYRTEYVNGQELYVVGGVYYRPVYRGGRRSYVVVRQGI